MVLAQQTVSSVPDEGQARRAERTLRASTERTRTLLKTNSGDGNRIRRLLALRDEANRLTDWDAMAKASAGAHWGAMSALQRSRFVHSFRELLLSYHLITLDRVESQPMPPLSVAEAEDRDSIWVEMHLAHRFFPIVIGFLVNRADQVVDIRAAGFRLSEHARETLTLAIGRDGLDSTLVRLEHKAAAARRQLDAEQVFKPSP